MAPDSFKGFHLVYFKMSEMTTNDNRAFTIAMITSRLILVVIIIEQLPYLNCFFLINLLFFAIALLFTIMSVSVLLIFSGP